MGGRSTRNELPVATEKEEPESGETSGAPLTRAPTAHSGSAVQGPSENSFEEALVGSDLRARETLAWQLCRSHSAPRDVVLALARDVDSVASPILEYSPLLTDEDLAEILSGPSVNKRIAVARRPGLGRRVAELLAEVGDSVALARLLENPTAHVSEQALMRTLERFPAHKALHACMIGRPALPESVSQLLHALVSPEWRQRLLARHRFPSQMGTDVVKQGRDRPAWWAAHLNAYFR